MKHLYANKNEQHHTTDYQLRNSLKYILIFFISVNKLTVPGGSAGSPSGGGPSPSRTQNFGNSPKKLFLPLNFRAFHSREHLKASQQNTVQWQILKILVV